MFEPPSKKASSESLGIPAAGGARVFRVRPPFTALLFGFLLMVAAVSVRPWEAGGKAYFIAAWLLAAGVAVALPMVRAQMFWLAGHRSGVLGIRGRRARFALAWARSALAGTVGVVSIAFIWASGWYLPLPHGRGDGLGLLLSVSGSVVVAGVLGCLGLGRSISRGLAPGLPQVRRFLRWTGISGVAIIGFALAAVAAVRLVEILFIGVGVDLGELFLWAGLILSGTAAVFWALVMANSCGWRLGDASAVQVLPEIAALLGTGALGSFLLLALGEWCFRPPPDGLAVGAFACCALCLAAVPAGACRGRVLGGRGVVLAE